MCAAGGRVSFSSKTQRNVALSSSEAEYRSKRSPPPPIITCSGLLHENGVFPPG